MESKKVMTNEQMRKALKKQGVALPKGYVKNSKLQAMMRKTKSPTKKSRARKPCKSGKRRSSKSGRCRLVKRKSRSKKPCKSNQRRSSKTGRCRKSKSGPKRRPGRPKGAKNKVKKSKKSRSKKPCKSGKRRSSKTGRCKKIKSKSRSKKARGRPKGAKNKPKTRAMVVYKSK